MTPGKHGADAGTSWADRATNVVLVAAAACMMTARIAAIKWDEGRMALVREGRTRRALRDGMVLDGYGAVAGPAADVAVLGSDRWSGGVALMIMPGFHSASGSVEALPPRIWWQWWMSMDDGGWRTDEAMLFALIAAGTTGRRPSRTERREILAASRKGPWGIRQWCMQEKATTLAFSPAAPTSAVVAAAGRAAARTRTSEAAGRLRAWARSSGHGPDVIAAIDRLAGVGKGSAGPGVPG